MADSGIILLPTPEHLSHDGFWMRIPSGGQVRVVGEVPNETVDRLTAAFVPSLPGDWTVTRAPRADAFVWVDAEARDLDPESYRIKIAQTGIQIEAGGGAGAFYAAMTLRQLARQRPGYLPVCRIEDTPDFPVRGATMDVSRDKVPQMETLFAWVDRLAEWKVNQIYLYTEHTFAYAGHETVWRDADPMTPAQVLELDAYCKDRFIELVPNQNSFGHFRRFLDHPEYRHLAEAPNGYALSRGRRSPHPYSLHPGDSGSLELLGDLYDQLLPHFTSQRFSAVV
jgi:N-acetyl-beta-hexosaminidase